MNGVLRESSDALFASLIRERDAVLSADAALGAANAVLDILARARFDVAPIFQEVVETAVRLCLADWAVLY